MYNLYRGDRYTWAEQQIEAVKVRDAAAVDWDSVLKMLEEIVWRHEASLMDGYRQVLELLLQFQYAAPPSSRLRRFQEDLDTVRHEIRKVVGNAPGLRRRRKLLLGKAWIKARENIITAWAEFGMDESGETDNDARIRAFSRVWRKWDQAIPRDNPYTLQKVQKRKWYPPRTDVDEGLHRSAPEPGQRLPFGPGEGADPPS